VIGTLIFADIPLAIWPESDPNWGWNDKCPGRPSDHPWNKVPANEDNWSAQVRAENVWNKRLAAHSDWQKQERTQTTWDKQDTRVEDHKKC
jgi:hypothetical protein